MILNNRKSGTINRLPTLCFYVAVQILAIICYITIYFIFSHTNEAASFAIDQFVNGTISIYTLTVLLHIFKVLHLGACCLNLPLVYTSFYQNWHSGALFFVSNLLLYLPSEAFVFKYIDAFNFNSTHWVILR
jgi:hypothetical protein